MNGIRTLLAATDFSDDARNAVARAALIAASQGAQLSLLHVMSGPSVETLRELFSAPAEAEQKLVADALHSLDELKSELVEKHPIAAVARVAVGRVLDELVAAAAQADMVVLGAHGLNPLRDMLLGTTAERLLGKCHVPVLIAKREPQGPYRRVVVPVDFSPHSLAALRMAKAIAPEATIAAVHAFQVPYEGKLWLAGVEQEKIEAYRIRTRQQALDALAATLRELDNTTTRFTRVVEQGDPSPIILAQAHALDADLIVMGKHGRSSLEELLIGSVTRHVLANAQCDVLVVSER